MRLLVAIFLLAGCSTVPGVNNNDEVMKVFNTWRAAFVNNEFDKIYELTSDQCKSEWLYTVFATKNPLSQSSYVMLPDGMIKDFDEWLKTALTFSEVNTRPTLLPHKLLTCQWLHDVLKKSYEEHRDKLIVEFANMKVVHFAKDDTGATITVKNFNNQSELYSAIQKEGKWYIDGHILPPLK